MKAASLKPNKTFKLKSGDSLIIDDFVSKKSFKELDENLKRDHAIHKRVAEILMKSVDNANALNPDFEA